jgi:hypothetical protein
VRLLDFLFGRTTDWEPDYNAGPRPQRRPPVRLNRVDVGRTERYDALPWSYWCRSCRRWGHGYASKRGANIGKTEHDCKRKQYNEEES